MLHRGFQHLRQNLALLVAEQILERIGVAAESLVQAMNGLRKVGSGEGIADGFAQVAVGFVGAEQRHAAVQIVIAEVQHAEHQHLGFLRDLAK